MYLRLLCQHCLTLHIWRWATGLGHFPKMNGNESREGNSARCADPPRARLTCFWQQGTSWERRAGDEEARQATQCYQRLQVFSIEDQNRFQSPHRASESVRVLNKKKWMEPLGPVIGHVCSCGSRWKAIFKGLKSYPQFCFILFCFNLTCNIVEGNYQAIIVTVSESGNLFSTELYSSTVFFFF